MTENSTSPQTLGRRSPTTIALDLLQQYGVLIAFAGLFLFNSIWLGDDFLKPENLRNLLNQNAAVGIVAVGMTLVIIAGGIDLSVGAVMAFAAAVGMLTMNRLAGPESSQLVAAFAGLFAAVGVGIGCGLLNGLMVTVGKIPAFIATLAGLIGFRSITLALAEGGEIRADSAVTVVQDFGRDGFSIPGVVNAYDKPVVFYWTIIVFLAVVVVGQLLLSFTRLGRHFVAVGSNELAARYSGIPVARVRIWAYSLVGLCAALGGILSTTRMNSVSSSQLGLYAELDAIAAVVIGGTSMAGGRGRVWGTLLGVLILVMITNMLSLLQVEVYWQGFVKGAIIVLAVLIQRGRAG
ncbi:MAG: ABC transporter permease [Planctomycetota bacterium]|nr:ABC transporter permease [Planctomycetota bacterium]